VGDELEYADEVTSGEYFWVPFEKSKQLIE
jgi:hypothetical protein